MSRESGRELWPLPGLEFIFHVNNLSFVCACCIHIHVCGDHKHVCPHACGSRKPTLDVFFLHHSPLQGLSLTLELTDSNLASQPALRIPYLCLLNAGVLGIQAQGLLLF